MLEYLLEFDQKLFLFLNGLRMEQLDMVMYYISYKFTWVPLYIILTVLLAKKYRWKALPLMIFVVILITMSDQGSVFFKNFFERLRPCRDPDLEGLVHLVRQRCGGVYGFVSSHATNAFALAIFMGKILNDRFRVVYPVMIVYAILNGYSRIYLGVHYPADVVFGSLLGIGIGLGVVFMWNKWEQYFYKPERVLPR
ncbi:MAG: phosphatase PAP2 family protein [Bacteroidales bacterium]